MGFMNEGTKGKWEATSFPLWRGGIYWEETGGTEESINEDVAFTTESFAAMLTP
jgi:hypothetical protein